MIALIVVRPEPGNAATVASARDAGFQVIAAPLFAIEARPWAVAPAAAYDSLLIGSANALRHAGPQLETLAQLPVYAVGEVTAEAARERGLTVAAVGRGGLDELLPALAASGRRRVLRLAGEERVPLDPPPAMRIETIAVYAAVPLPLTCEAAQASRDGALVLLHSAAAARHLRGELQRFEVRRADVALACLGPRIAAAAGDGWRHCRSAASPDDGALLALAAEMCDRSALGMGNIKNA